MKKLILITVIAWVAVTISSVWAAEEMTSFNSAKMQNIIYGATIDAKVSFYQKRIYLVDSEYKVLADIGKDAVKKIAFLKANRQSLINTMIDKNIAYTSARMNSFLGTKIHEIGSSMAAYSDSIK